MPVRDVNVIVVKIPTSVRVYWDCFECISCNSLLSDVYEIHNCMETKRVYLHACSCHYEYPNGDADFYKLDIDPVLQQCQTCYLKSIPFHQWPLYDQTIYENLTY